MIGSTRVAILHSGLIAVLNGRFPVQELIEISDALLATPLTVAAISLAMPDGLDAIAALRARHGEHMLFGASDVGTRKDAAAAVAHGAQFLLLQDAPEAVVRAGHALGILTIPRVTTTDAAQQAARLHCRMAHFYPADAAGPAALATVRRDWPQMAWIAGGGIDAATLAAYHHAGAQVFTTGNRPLPQLDWQMDTLIRNARTLRSALRIGQQSAENR